MEVTPEDVKRRLDAGEALALIDVREPFEHAVARLEGAELIPMQTVPENLAALQEKAAQAPLIVLCHHGVRSLNVVHWLRRQGIENCWSMAGGIDFWSISVDPAVPRY
jgi:adenylyltransferase/sulfurtransferase